MKVIEFEDLIDQFAYFLLDAYGVFWGSSETGMLPGAEEMMKRLLSQGKKVGILSNASQLVSKEKEKLRKHGVEEGTHFHFLLTSGEATRELLLSRQLPFPTPKMGYHLFGHLFEPEHPRYSVQALFEGSGFEKRESIEEADFIYIPVPHLNGLDQTDPRAFAAQIKEYATKKVPFLCANPDQYAHEGSPKRLVVRQGTIARLLQEQGAEVHFVGKPHPYVYQKALKLFSVEPKEVLMVGDTPETDIRGAKQVGIATALVTQTGIMRERIEENGISELSHKDNPDYFIRRFSSHEF
ncbi:TIGR01459 family HAD-type hydrolase [Chlamydiota bacterium]